MRLPRVSTGAGIGVSAAILLGYAAYALSSEKSASTVSPTQLAPGKSAATESAPAPDEQPGKPLGPKIQSAEAQGKPNPEPPAEGTRYELHNFNVSVTIPSHWTCSKTEPFDGLAVIDCAGGLKFSAATAGDDKNISDFELHVLGPDAVGRQRMTFGNHKAILWGERSEALGYSSHCAFYRGDVEYVIDKRASQFDSVRDFQLIAASIKPL
jgi:hypothetical protein